MSLATQFRREARVALSRRAQPVWFRVLKWVLILAGGAMLWGTRYFWPVLGAALALSLTLHAVWRWKTRGWTRPWGGWDDVDTAGRP
jgi:hypothetical protein